MSNPKSTECGAVGGCISGTDKDSWAHLYRYRMAHSPSSSDESSRKTHERIPLDVNALECGDAREVLWKGLYVIATEIEGGEARELGDRSRDGSEHVGGDV